MKLIKIEPSALKTKKWTAIFEHDGKTTRTHFGAAGANDFTITGDTEARKRYLTRHKKDLDTKDPTRAGYLSYYILWNKPTMAASIRDYKQRFNL
jgi:hypothetical protein